MILIIHGCPAFGDFRHTPAGRTKLEWAPVKNPADL